MFYLVYEGEGTEYDYFSRVDQEYGRGCGFIIRTPPRSVRKNGLSPSQVVEQAAEVAHDRDIREVWGLFDHDRRPEIDQVCIAAKQRDINIALSHPAFELWLLLHFQEFSAARQDGSDKEIVEKLRKAHSVFANYNADSKRITDERFEALTADDGIAKAFARAKRLAANFVGESPGNSDPSTNVYRLIENLGVVRGSR